MYRVFSTLLTETQEINGILFEAVDGGVSALIDDKDIAEALGSIPGYEVTDTEAKPAADQRKPVRINPLTKMPLGAGARSAALKAALAAEDANDSAVFVTPDEAAALIAAAKAAPVADAAPVVEAPAEEAAAPVVEPEAAAELEVVADAAAEPEVVAEETPDAEGAGAEETPQE